MRSKTTKRLLVLFVVLAVTSMFSLQAFASVWTFNSSGQGNMPFAPRGYSVKIGNTEYWLNSSGFNHDGKSSGNGNNTTYSISYVNGFEEPVEKTSLPEGTYIFKAWFDKQPMGSGAGGNNNGAPNNFMAANNETYKDFIVVKTGSGSYNPVGLTASYVNNAARSASVADPDGHANQWYVEFQMSIVSGTTYTFGFLQGFEANNGNTLVLCPSTTLENNQGYIGFVSADDTNHQTIYNSNRHNEYIYPVIDEDLGDDSDENIVYSIIPKPFEHTLTATT